jgi:hypothetical protein
MMNRTGKVNVTSVPNTTAVPRRMAAIPRYIGLLLTRKGPEVTSDIGDSKCDNVVLFFKNNERHQRPTTKPKPMMSIPKQVYGA